MRVASRVASGLVEAPSFSKATGTMGPCFGGGLQCCCTPLSLGWVPVYLDGPGATKGLASWSEGLIRYFRVLVRSCGVHRQLFNFRAHLDVATRVLKDYRDLKQYYRTFLELLALDGSFQKSSRKALIVRTPT